MRLDVTIRTRGASCSGARRFCRAAAPRCAALAQAGCRIELEEDDAMEAPRRLLRRGRPGKRAGEAVAQFCLANRTSTLIARRRSGGAL